MFAEPAAPGIHKIIVAVVNDKKEAVHPATVGLLRSKDSVLVKAGITDSPGMTQPMEGLTHFQQSDEYFKLIRDSRVCTIGFTFRFGNHLKQYPNALPVERGMKWNG